VRYSNLQLDFQVYAVTTQSETIINLFIAPCQPFSSGSCSYLWRCLRFKQLFNTCCVLKDADPVLKDADPLKHQSQHVSIYLYVYTTACLQVVVSGKPIDVIEVDTIDMLINIQESKRISFCPVSVWPHQSFGFWVHA